MLVYTTSKQLSDRVIREIIKKMKILFWLKLIHDTTLPRRRKLYLPCDTFLWHL